MTNPLRVRARVLYPGSTIMGSRNGHAAIYMWYTFMKKGYDGVAKDVEKCMVNARHLKKLLEHVGVKCMLNELSSTVVFERPGASPASPSFATYRILSFAPVSRGPLIGCASSDNKLI